MKHTYLQYLKVVLLFLPLIAYGQDYEISGRVMDENSNEFLPYANVILKSSQELVISGVITDDNGYFIVNAKTGNYILEISSLGYSPKIINLEVKENQDLKLIVLKEAAEELEGVSIIFRKPTIKRQDGILTMNVENTALSQLGNAIDVVRSTPSLMVTPENDVKVFGKGKAQIYVDGRRVEDPSELSLINSNSILKVEVIRNPSAKYDAEGNAVVLITTTKNVDEGFSSRLTFKYDKREFTRFLGGITLNYKKGAVNFYSLYNYNPKKVKKIDEYNRVFSNANQTQTTMKNVVENVSNFKNMHNFKFGSSLELTKDQLLGLSYNFAVEGDDLNTDNKNQILNLVNQDFLINTLINTEVRNRTNSFNINYLNRLDTIGRKISLQSNYTSFESSSLGRIDETRTNTAGDLDKENVNKNDIDVYTTALDYTHPIGDKLIFDLGMKYTKIANSSNLDLSNSVDQSVIEQEGFKYDENIYAAYGELGKNYKKFRAKIGLRMENTVVRGVSKSNNEMIIDSSYVNFFPSVGLSYTLNEDVELSFNYTNRIVRPDIQDLNPFINFIDSFSILKGNPKLQPEQINGFEMSVEYQETVNLELSYNKTKRPINDFLFNDNFVSIATIQNYQNNEEASAGLSIPYELDWWTTYNYIGATHVFNTRLSQDITSSLNLEDKTYWQFVAQNTFRLPKKFNIRVTYSYTSDQRDGIYTIDPIQFFSISLGKKLLNDQLNITFNAQDIFDTYRINSSTSLDNFKINADQFLDVRAFIFSVVYNFGNKYKKKKENKFPELDRVTKD